jgi:hypothetical protein
MSERSRERWRRFSLLGRIRVAQEAMKAVRLAPHLPPEVQEKASQLETHLYALQHLVAKHTHEPVELSPKKGS